MNEPIRVLIADDHSLVRAGFQSVLSIEDDITVVGEARNGAEAVTLARAASTRCRPDGYPDARDGRPGSDPADHVRSPAATEPAVVVLTTFDLDEYVFGA